MSNLELDILGSQIFLNSLVTIGRTMYHIEDSGSVFFLRVLLVDLCPGWESMYWNWIFSVVAHILEKPRVLQWHISITVCVLFPVFLNVKTWHILNDTGFCSNIGCGWYWTPYKYRQMEPDPDNSPPATSVSGTFDNWLRVYHGFHGAVYLCFFLAQFLFCENLQGSSSLPIYHAQDHGKHGFPQQCGTLTTYVVPIPAE